MVSGQREGLASGEVIVREAAAFSVEFVEKMNEKFPKVKPGDYEYAVVPGRKYDKIVRRNPDVPLAMSAEAFVDPENGLVYKPAGWSAPAKGPRYSLVEQGVEYVVAKADRHGGYLYVGRG
jgi:hypothetical protein